MPNWELVQSVVKAMDIIEEIADAEYGMRLNEISGKLNIKNTTVHNLMRTLTSKGFLEKNSNHCYTLGTALEQLVEKSLVRKISNVLASEMRLLAQKIPNSVIVASEIARSEIIVRFRMSPDRPDVLQKPLNQILLPYSSASGLLHMAFSKEDMEQILLHYPFSSYGIHVWKDEENLEKCLEHIRKNNYSVGDSICEDGFFKMAVPVWGKHSEMRFALAIRIRDKDISSDKKEKIKELMFESAQKLSLTQKL